MELLFLRFHYLYLFHTRPLETQVEAVVRKWADLHMVAVVTHANNGDLWIFYQTNQLLQALYTRQMGNSKRIKIWDNSLVGNTVHVKEKEPVFLLCPHFLPCHPPHPLWEGAYHWPSEMHLTTHRHTHRFSDYLNNWSSLLLLHFTSSLNPFQSNPYLQSVALCARS